MNVIWEVKESKFLSEVYGYLDKIYQRKWKNERREKKRRNLSIKFKTPEDTDN